MFGIEYYISDMSTFQESKHLTNLIKDDVYSGTTIDIRKLG